MANDLVSVWGGSLRIGRAPANNELLIGDGSGFALQTVAITLDNILGSTQGSIAYRSATQWTQLTPGTANNVLQTNGAAQNPTWVTPEVVVNNALGGSDGAIAYRTSGDWSALAVGNTNNVLASTGSAPSWTTISGLFDSYFTNARQALIARGPSGWGYLAPSASPYLLLTNNTGNTNSDVGWTTLTNAIDGGTGAGSLFIGDMLYRNASGNWARLQVGASSDVLSVVNPGTGNQPAWRTVSQLFDAYWVGATAGATIYKGASTWDALGIGPQFYINMSNGSQPTWSSQSYVLDNGTGGSSALGSMLYRASTEWTKLNIGSSSFVMSSSGSAPQWSDLRTLFDTYFGSSRGNIISRGASTWGFVTIGASGRVLTSNGTDPFWGNSWQTLYKASPQSITTTSYVNDSDLQFAVANGQSFLVEANILYSTGAGGMLLAVNGPALFLQFTAGSGSSVTAVNTTIASVTGSGNFAVSFSGLFQANASGTFAIRHSLNTASGTTTIQAGSWMKVYAL